MPNKSDNARPAPGCTTRIIWWIEEAQARGFLPLLNRISLSTWQVQLFGIKDRDYRAGAQRGTAEEAFMHAMTAAMDGKFQAPREIVEGMPEPEPEAAPEAEDTDFPM